MKNIAAIVFYSVMLSVAAFGIGVLCYAAYMAPIPVLPLLAFLVGMLYLSRYA